MVQVIEWDSSTLEWDVLSSWDGAWSDPIVYRGDDAVDLEEELQNRLTAIDGWCGDGIKYGIDEECDGQDFGGKDCTGISDPCSAECELDAECT